MACLMDLLTFHLRKNVLEQFVTVTILKAEDCCVQYHVNILWWALSATFPGWMDESGSRGK